MFSSSNLLFSLLSLFAEMIQRASIQRRSVDYDRVFLRNQEFRRDGLPERHITVHTSRREGHYIVSTFDEVREKKKNKGLVGCSWISCFFSSLNGVSQDIPNMGGERQRQRQRQRANGAPDIHPARKRSPINSLAYCGRVELAEKNRRGDFSHCDASLK